MATPIAPTKRAKTEPCAPAVAAPRNAVEPRAARAPRRAGSGVESIVSTRERFRRIEGLLLEEQAAALAVETKVAKELAIAARIAVAEARADGSHSGTASIGRVIDVQSGSDDDLLGPLNGVGSASAPTAPSWQQPVHNLFEGVFGPCGTNNSLHKPLSI